MTQPRNPDGTYGTKPAVDGKRALSQERAKGYVLALATGLIAFATGYALRDVWGPTKPIVRDYAGAGLGVNTKLTTEWDYPTPKGTWDFVVFWPPAPALTRQEVSQAACWVCGCGNRDDVECRTAWARLGHP